MFVVGGSRISILCRNNRFMTPILRSVPRALASCRAVGRVIALLVCAPTLTIAQSPAGPPPGRVRQGADASQLSPDDVVRKLRSLTDSLARQDRFSGVVLLARNGTPLLMQAYGLSDREAKRRNTVATTFNVSSIGKLFTMMAVAQLVADGRLSLDGTIAKYWPEYPDTVAARKITIRHLLEHRSGITGDIFANPTTRRSNHAAVELVVHNPLAFEPGTRTEYSNAGYVILGEIIERVTHEDYHDYVAKHVFTPAGMTATGFPSNDALPATAAIGYTRGLDEDAPPPSPLPPLRRNTPEQPRRGSAAGGSYSNVNDLLRFIMARRNGTLGAPARRAQNISAGGSPGSNGIIAEGLPGDYDLIVLSNFDPPAAGAIEREVEGWLGGGRGGAGRVRIGGPGGAPAPAPVSGASTTLPDTPVGRAAGAYLKAFATGDTSVMRSFLTTGMAPGQRSTDERLSQYREMFSDNGIMTLVGVDAATDSEITMRVNGTQSGPLVITVRIEPASPYRIIGIQFRMER